MSESVQTERAPVKVDAQDNAGAGLQDNLLSTLRHDLRTPINHIIGYSELLLETAQEQGQTELVASIQKIHGAGTALLTHIDTYLGSTAQVGAIELEPLSYELRTQLNAIVGYSEMLRDEAGEQGFDDLATDLGRIYGAGKHLLGMVNAVLELSKTESGQLNGDGVTADGANRGRDESASRRRTAEPKALDTQLQAYTVLVVDDNEINRDMLARRLGRLGYHVTLAEDGPQALARLKTEPADLVLLDILMPGMDGYHVLEHLKADETLQHVPVIALSAMDELESVVRCIQLGAEDYLVLPANPVLLSARITTCLERKHLRDQELQHLRQVEAALAAQKEANEQLERLNKIKGDFVSIVSHEFRTPLTGIQGFSEMMVEEDLSLEEMKEFAGDIYKDAKRLSRLITEMLDLDRMESGRVTLKLEPVDLNAILTDVAALVRPNAPNHPLVLMLDDGLPRLMADSDKLTQVATNLLNNAVKYSPGGGKIIISSQIDGQLAHVRVRDHGLGMPAEALEIIFDRYTRIETSAARHIMGTGLGLPIVRQIVQMHGGKAWAESTLGEGSTFHFTIPLEGST